MKKKFIISIFILLAAFKINAQATDDLNAIKLFLSPETVADANNTLQQNLQDRIYRRITQLINQTGITEIGFSSFVVYPKLDILSTSSDQASMSQVFLAECELGIAIRRSDIGGKGGATFNSFSKSINGSGSSKDEAVTNAINNISVNDKDIVEFFNKSKQKIDAYFKAHCKDVAQEAKQALNLKQYERSIALYFSIPSDAPCYKEAFDACQKVYKTFVEDECNSSLRMLKSYVALAQNDRKYYDSALNTIRNMSPASDMCYAEAKVVIEKIEKRLDDEQKQQWDLAKKMSADESEVKKEMYKAMGRISSTYQPPPPPSTNVIIAQ